MTNKTAIMNCKQARISTALSVGSDLSEAEERALRSHLESCPECRRRAERLRSSLERLKAPVDPKAGSLHDSIWPSLSGKLTTRGAARGAAGSPYWLPTVAVMAASIVLVVMWRSPTQWHQRRSSSGPVVAQPIPQSHPTYHTSASGGVVPDFFRPSRFPFAGRYESAMLPRGMRDPLLIPQAEVDRPLMLNPEHFAGDTEGMPPATDDSGIRSLDVDPLHFSD